MSGTNVEAAMAADHVTIGMADLARITTDEAGYRWLEIRRPNGKYLTCGMVSNTSKAPWEAYLQITISDWIDAAARGQVTVTR